MGNPPHWKVLLLGGHSGVGKTLAARRLAQRFGVGLAEVDDFRLVLERMTTPQQQPALHTLLDRFWRSEIAPDAVCDALIAVAQTVSYALEIVVANHVATDTPTILEGDGIVPAFAAKRIYANREVESSVRAVFLIEDDARQLYRNAIGKGRGFDALPEAVRRRLVRVSWLYGRWLRQEAFRYNLAVVPPRPWETLDERILGAIK
jgi:2-phosphoglycerate kinase